MMKLILRCRWRVVGVAVVLCLSAFNAFAQATVDQWVAQLGSKDPDARLKAVRAIKGLGDPATAGPLAGVVVDPENEIQVEAIAAVLNIYLVDKVTPSRRVGFIVERRGTIAAEPIFAAGPSAIGPRRVPLPVASALIAASHDDDPRVALEGIYALGALGGEVARADRGAALAQAAPVLAGLLGAPDPGIRLAALRVAGALFARRGTEPEVPEVIGDAAIAALNDRDDTVREGAMWALGSMKYNRAVRGLTELYRFYRRGPFLAASLDSLAHIGNSGSTPEMVEQLTGKNAILKLIAIEGLARIGDKSRATAIHSSIATERGEAMLLGGHFAMAMLADGKVDAIVEAAGRSNLFEQARSYLRELAPGRVAQLSPFVQSPDPRMRLVVVEALGTSGDPAAAATVTPAQQDPDPAVARAATRALALLR